MSEYLSGQHADWTRASEGPETNFGQQKITTRDQVKGDSAIDTGIRQFQRRFKELQSSLTLASNAPTVTPALQRHLETMLAQFHTLYEEYEMNLLRENDAPMSLNLALPPISIPEFNGEYLD